MSEALEGERTVSAVAAKKAWLTPKRKAIAIGIGTAVVVGFVFWKNPGQKKEEEPAAPPPQGMGQNVTYEPPKPLPMPAPVQATPPPLPAPARETPATLPEPRPISSVVPPTTNAAAKPPKPPRMISYATDEGNAGISAGGRSGTNNGSSGVQSDGTHVTYKGSEIVGAKAGPALDRDLLLMPGIIRCILDTAIDSTLPGPLMCHLPGPVISSGGVVLMEKDTQIIGEYKNEVAQGQGRLMAVTATAYTPNGIPVPLGGPFADGLGRTGLEGNVDNHLMARFGGAVLLSLSQSVLSIAQAAVSKGGNSYVSFSSGGVGSLAQDVLNSTINIKPTITKNQGDEVSLWVMTPIDFSNAYHLGNR